MEYLVASILGLVQGLTEFLPISSSGHLAIVNLIFGHELAGGISFMFFLHIATLIAAIIYFWDDIRGLLVCWLPKNKEMKKERKLFIMLIIVCLVTGPIGLALEGRLEDMSNSLIWLACGFFCTTLVLFAAEWISRSHQESDLSDMTMPQAALVGLFQGLAVVPGLSRSGATISGGLMAGLSRVEATRFAFLVGLPIIAVGALKDGVDMLQGELILPPWSVSLLGFVIAGVSGYLAISWMIATLKRIKLYWFGAYTALLGIVLLVVWAIGR
ncbi:MAG: undecaprenyl-diphosphate phosphatase [Coriobacteriia bacterium]|nr:undecaprenyl-diphosphate phosphatase [Coriobacteriia bacterium]